MKRRHLLLVLLSLIISVCMLAIAGCGSCGDAVALPTPVVNIDKNGVASWAADENASGYSYKIDDGEEKATTGTSVTLKNGQSISVKAVGDGKNYLDSDWSEVKTFRKPAEKLGTPVVTIDEDGLASWTADSNASKYLLKIDTTESETTETTVQLTDGQSIQVKAVAASTAYIDSEWSEVQTYDADSAATLPHLTKPTVTVDDNGVASWTADTDAVGYSVKINDNDPYETDDTEVSLSLGDTIQVKALGDGVNNLDSEWSDEVKYEEKAPETPGTLKKPVVVVDEHGFATWVAVPNASGYAYKINDVAAPQSLPATTHAVHLENVGDKIQVKALGDGENYLDSDWSDVAVYEDSTLVPAEPEQLSTPILTINGSGLAQWSPVLNTTKYAYQIGTAEPVVTTDRSKQLSDGESIKVKAVGDGKYFSDSEWTETKTYTAGSDNQPDIALSSHAQFLAADKGADIKVMGVVTGMTNNHIYFQDGDGGYLLYEKNGLSADVKSQVSVGKAIVVTGKKDIYTSSTYKGLHEIISATVEVVSTGNASAVDVTNKFIAASAMTDTALYNLQSMLVTIKGVTLVKDGDNYFVSIGNNSAQFYLKGSSQVLDSTALNTVQALFEANIGKTADVTGYVTLYHDTFQLQPSLGGLKVVLDAPVVETTSTGAYWTPNPNASGYKYVITHNDGTTVENTTALTSITLQDKDKIKVKALGGGDYKDSAYSEEKTYNAPAAPVKLAAPTVTVAADGTVSWSHTDPSVTFKYYLGNNLTAASLAGVQWTVPQSGTVVKLDGDHNSIAVVACAYNEMTLDSDAKIITKLDKPTGFNFGADTANPGHVLITWTKPANAGDDTKYTVVINGTEHNADNEEYSILLKSYTSIKVKANASNGFAESDWVDITAQYLAYYDANKPNVQTTDSTMQNLASSGNMSGDNNNAETSNLDPNIFYVKSEKTNNGQNHVGLSGGVFRLYKNETATLTVTAQNGVEIDSIQVTLASGNNTTTDFAVLKVVVDDNTVTGDDGEYLINSTSFALSNTDADKQIWIESIVISHTVPNFTDEQKVNFVADALAIPAPYETTDTEYTYHLPLTERNYNTIISWNITGLQSGDSYTASTGVLVVARRLGTTASLSATATVSLTSGASATTNALPISVPAIVVTPLGIPNVAINSTGLASWAAVPNATGYVIKLNNVDQAETTDLSKQLANGDKIQVKAVSNSVLYSDSDFSAEQTYVQGQRNVIKLAELDFAGDDKANIVFSKKNQAYTGSFDATYDKQTWTFTNFNNQNAGSYGAWMCVKAGHSTYTFSEDGTGTNPSHLPASVSTTIADTVKYFVIKTTIAATNRDSVTGVKLIVNNGSGDHEVTVNLDDFKAGEVTINIPEQYQGEGYTYTLKISMTNKSNGFVEFNSIACHGYAKEN